MLTITQTAYTRLEQRLADRPDDVAVRIILRDGHVKFRPDKKRTGDAVFKHKGRSVLLVGKNTIPRIGNRILDVVETDDGPRLRIHRPK